MSLEERLKGARQKRRRDDLLAVPLREAHLPRARVIIRSRPRSSSLTSCATRVTANIKPANILVKLPDPNLRGAQMKTQASPTSTSQRSPIRTSTCR